MIGQRSWISYKTCTAQKTKLSIKDYLQIWSHLLRKSLMENFIFCVVLSNMNSLILNFIVKFKHLITGQDIVFLACENNSQLIVVKTNFVQCFNEKR